MLQITAQFPLKAKLFSPPPKKPSTREREYLRTDEIRAMIRAAKKVGRHGKRLMIATIPISSTMPAISPRWSMS